MRSFLTALGCLAILATACTAIVSGKLSDKDGYTKSGASSGIGSSGSGSTDKCSLLADPRYGNTKEKNECSDCIETQCKGDVEFACNRDGTSKKAWFDDLAGCAQNPFIAYGPSGSSFYDCNKYADAGAPFTGSQESDSAKQRNSEICVNTKCMGGSTPPCRLCPVYINKPQTTERAELGLLPCGQCIEQNCKAQLVECCDTPVVSTYITACAFVDAPELKTKCNEIIELDGGKINGQNDTDGERGEACQIKVRDCFKKCQSTCQ